MWQLKLRSLRVTASKGAAAKTMQTMSGSVGRWKMEYEIRY